MKVVEYVKNINKDKPLIFTKGPKNEKMSWSLKERAPIYKAMAWQGRGGGAGRSPHN